MLFALVAGILEPSRWVLQAVAQIFERDTAGHWRRRNGRRSAQSSVAGRLPRKRLVPERRAVGARDRLKPPPYGRYRRSHGLEPWLHSFAAPRLNSSIQKNASVAAKPRCFR